MGSVLMIIAIANLKMGIVWTPFESIVEVLLINVLFKYWPEKGLSGKLAFIFHVPVAFAGVYFKTFVSKAWNMSYGTFPFMIAFAGMLSARGDRWGRFWIICSMAKFGHFSNEVFGKEFWHKAS